jgi:hypothetical protein
MFTISSHSRRLRSERRTGAELIGQGGQFYRIRARHFSTAQESPRYRSEPRSTQMITLSARTRAFVVKTSARHRTALRSVHRAAWPWVSAFQSAPRMDLPRREVEPRPGFTVAAGPRPEARTTSAPLVSSGCGAHGIAEQRHAHPPSPGPRRRPWYPPPRGRMPRAPAVTAGAHLGGRMALIA